MKKKNRATKLKRGSQHRVAWRDEMNRAGKNPSSRQHLKRGCRKRLQIMNESQERCWDEGLIPMKNRKKKGIVYREM